MWLRDKDKPAAAEALMYSSVVCVVLALFGATGNGLWLASTQWLVVGALLAIWGVYLLLVAHFRLK